MWPVGQAVKTPASHAGNGGSIPPRVTKTIFQVVVRNRKLFLQYPTGRRKPPLRNIVGVDDGEGPPVPIPNTEVKLISAEDTWLVTARDNRMTPTLIFLNSSAGRACGC